jgi:biopolymer transport protein TolR
MAMSAGGDPSRPEMNVTPLIDVLLVLIIIFMVIVVEQGNKGITAQIPQPAKDATEPDRERTIVVQLVSVPGQDQPPALKINQQTVGWGNLGSELQRVFATRAEKVAFVRGDQDVNFEYVADVIDTARRAGVERVGLMGKDQ